MRSIHQQSVRQFMQHAKQRTPEAPVELTEAERVLRARLILEEALETVQALGVRCQLRGHVVAFEDVEFSLSGSFNMVETVDGCCDLSVVTVGTLVACGVSDLGVLIEVDQNNLDKFGPGSYVDAAGKLQKPPNHPKPNLESVLKGQGWGIRNEHGEYINEPAQK